jgi:hypothetical protein
MALLFASTASVEYDKTQPLVVRSGASTMPSPEVPVSLTITELGRSRQIFWPTVAVSAAQKGAVLGGGQGVEWALSLAHRRRLQPSRDPLRSVIEASTRRRRCVSACALCWVL